MTPFNFKQDFADSPILWCRMGVCSKSQDQHMKRISDWKLLSWHEECWWSFYRFCHGHSSSTGPFFLFCFVLFWFFVSSKGLKRHPETKKMILLASNVNVNVIIMETFGWGTSTLVQTCLCLTRLSCAWHAPKLVCTLKIPYPSVVKEWASQPECGTRTKILHTLG